MAQPKKNLNSQEAGVQPERLYQKLARDLFSDLVAGRYAVGDRLPAERELSVQYNVSRPAVREAMIALEVQGLIEVRIGSGAYVRKLPGEADAPGFTVTAFELMEARLLIEGEAAALAAVHIRDDELVELERLVVEIERENRLRRQHRCRPRLSHADRHRDAQCRDPQSGRGDVAPALDLAQLRAAAGKGAHRQCPAGGRGAQGGARCAQGTRPGRARAAMRGHMSAVINHLLFATEEEAIEAARRNVATTRERYARAAQL